jgi:hypothetical protein
VLLSRFVVLLLWKRAIASRAATAAPHRLLINERGLGGRRDACGSRGRGDWDVKWIGCLWLEVVIALERKRKHNTVRVGLTGVTLVQANYVD